MFLLRWCSTVVKWITFLFITVGGIDHRNNEAVEFEVCHADEFVLGKITQWNLGTLFVLKNCKSLFW